MLFSTIATLFWYVLQLLMADEPPLNELDRPSNGRPTGTCPSVPGRASRLALYSADMPAVPAPAADLVD